LLSVDGGLRFGGDVGFGDKLVSGLEITSLFAVVQDVDVKPGTKRD
jgi:hypothetical protein